MKQWSQPEVYLKVKSVPRSKDRKIIVILEIMKTPMHSVGKTYNFQS